MFGLEFIIDLMEVASEEIRKSTYRISTGDDYDTEYTKAYADFSTQSNKDLIEWLDVYDRNDIDDAPEIDALYAVLKKRGLK